ncbi:MAG: hypothetical protein HKN43_04605 [Rhodothermales bacterium]|nr:hypothetical protein [Rhodothermales bacterium]
MKMGYAMLLLLLVISFFGGFQLAMSTIKLTEAEERHQMEIDLAGYREYMRDANTALRCMEPEDYLEYHRIRIAVEGR